MLKKIRNAIIILLCSVAAGSLLLTLVYALPVDAARENVKSSLYDMLEVAEDPQGDRGRKEIIALKDNFTDSLMVQNALEKVEGKSPWAHAMWAYHHDLGNDTSWMTEKSLAAFLRQGTDGMYLREYSKYWHGYLIYLKPLLMCMSWKSVETFLAVFQIILLAAVFALACFKRKYYLGMGIVCAFLFMKPLSVWFSLTLSDCWSIVLLTTAVFLLFYDKLEKKDRYAEAFLLAGIVTAYLDFLTYPVVTLGIPLCLWLVLSMETCGGWKKQLARGFWNSAFWVAGYVGMWGMKWVLAGITCQSRTLKDAVWSIIYRTTPLDGYQSAFSGVSRTVDAILQQYDSPAYGIGFGALAAAAFISVVWCGVKARGANWAVTITCLAVVALFPFGWLVLTQNHTAIHCVYTFRIMGVTVMALWCMIVSSVITIRRGRQPHIR